MILTVQKKKKKTLKGWTFFAHDVFGSRVRNNLAASCFKPAFLLGQSQGCQIPCVKWGACWEPGQGRGAEGAFPQ